MHVSLMRAKDGSLEIPRFMDRSLSKIFGFDMEVEALPNGLALSPIPA